MMQANAGKKRCLEEVEKEAENDDQITHINGSIYFYSEVSTPNILKLLECLKEANQFCCNTGQPLSELRVKVYIHTSGGDAFAGMSGMDHLRKNQVPVVTIADGFVASAGTFLLLGGYERHALKNSRLLIHQLSTGFWGKYADLLDEVKNSKELMTSFKKIYKTNTGMNVSTLKCLLKKEVHFNAQQALEFGFVSKII